MQNGSPFVRWRAANPPPARGRGQGAMVGEARIGRNLGAIALAHVAAQVLAFTVSLAVSRTLGVDPYGVFVFGFAFPSWFVLLVSAGLDYVVTIDVAADRKKASAYLTAVAVLRVPLALAALALLGISLLVLVSDPFARTVVFLLGVASVLSAYNGTFDAVFRAHERFDCSAAVMIAERAIATGAVLLLIALGKDLLAVSAVYILSALAATALSLFLLRRRFAWFVRPLAPSLGTRLLRRAVPFGLSALVSALMFSTPVVLLTFLRGPAAAGLFNAAFVLLLALMAPLQMYNLVFLPRMSRLYHGAPSSLASLLLRTQRLSFAFALPVAVGGALYAEALVVGLYGDAFQGSGAVLSVLLFVLAAATASLGAGTALGATDRAYLDLRFGALGAGINVAMCVLLIPSMGPAGAAWAFLVASTAIAVSRLRATSGLIAPYRVVETTARPVAAAAVMVLVILLTLQPTLPIALLLGSSVYFSVLAAVRGVTREDLGILAEIARGAFRSPPASGFEG